MKATKLLETQHRKVETLFKKLESGKGSLSENLKDLADSLAAHMAIEQQIFYPAIREIKEDMVAESYEEHAVAELSLKRLLSSKPGSAAFHAKVTVLKELIEHHVEEEEEELFPAVEKKMEAATLEALGKQMKTAFDEHYERGFEKLVPGSMAKTSSDQELGGRGTAKPTGRVKHNGSRVRHAHN